MTKSKIISIIKSMNEDDFEDFSEAFEEHIVASDYHKQFLRQLEIYKSENNLINLYNLVETLLKRDKCKIKEMRLDDYDIWISYNRGFDNKGLSFGFSRFEDFCRKHN